MRSPAGVRRRLLAFALFAMIILGPAACGGGGSATTGGAGVDAVSSAGSSAPGGAETRHESVPQAGPTAEAAAVGRASGSQGGNATQERSPPQEGRGSPEGPGTSTAKSDRSRPGGSAHHGAGHGPLTRASAEAAERAARRRARAAHRRLARKAGAAAPFLVEAGDNSIPTYGSEASAAQTAVAEAALSTYLGARAAGEWAAACGQMSAGLQKQLGALGGEAIAGGGCPTAYGKLAGRIPAAARSDPLTAGLTALRVESPHAFALFYGPGEQQYMMPLEEEGGAWKVTQIEAVPWPIGSTQG